jgi:polysaccharide pyruvyl transferase WcaK-like protein
MNPTSSPNFPSILLGGVPFGRNNVGDEAILECVVHAVRKLRPHARITASTDDPATAQRLGVRTVELFGFEPPFSHATMRHEVASHDAFIWAGATGLSDYPEIPPEMLRIAQAAGKTNVVWNVGMNSDLNPAKYRLRQGRKKQLLSLASQLSLGTWNGPAWWEQQAEARARKVIRDSLSRCDLVVVRDPESKTELERSGVDREVVVGADTALLQQARPDDQLELTEENRQLLFGPAPRFGFCVSAQREIRGRDRLIALLDRLTAELGMSLIFIPMNPITDAALMAGLKKELRQPERATVIEGRRDPDEILAIARHLDVVAASRLHLLILSSIYHIPLIGISRGSKVDNFLAPFGLQAVGTVEECNFDAFFNEVRRLLDGKTSFAAHSHTVRKQLMARLDHALARLDAVLPR